MPHTFLIASSVLRNRFDEKIIAALLIIRYTSFFPYQRRHSETRNRFTIALFSGNSIPIARTFGYIINEKNTNYYSGTEIEITRDREVVKETKKETFESTGRCCDLICLVK